MLEKLELDLAAGDPRLAQELSTGFVKNRFTASKCLAAITCLIGVLLLIAGIAAQLIIVGVGGFLLVGAGTYFLVEGTRWTLASKGAARLGGAFRRRAIRRIDRRG